MIVYLERACFTDDLMFARNGWYGNGQERI
jgi:hypothetical protein